MAGSSPPSSPSSPEDDGSATRSNASPASEAAGEAEARSPDAAGHDAAGHDAADDDAADDDAADDDAADDDAADVNIGDADERARRRLLKPIGGLYALAQALTGTERAARRLVEATYERAAEALARRRPAPPPAHSDADARAWIFKLLVKTAREAPGEGERFGEEDAAEEEAEDHPDAGDRHFQHRAQERFLRRALPPAFATLTPAQRLLLTLCDVEGLDLATAGSVTDCSERDTRQQHARARADLRDALRQMAPRPERSLLSDDALPDARLTGALCRMARRDLTAPPPALRPAARHALSHPPVPSRSAPAGDAAADRPARSPSGGEAPPDDSTKRSPGRLKRLLVALFLIAVAGGLGYLATTVLNRPGTTDLAALSAEHASGVNVRLRTERAERAEQFVRDELGRRLRVPHIEGTRLRGVGVAEVAPEERVPVFLFRNASTGHPVTAYAYDYALLDRTQERLRLSDDLRRRLQKEGRVATQDIGGQRVLLWRHRDDIFAAVADRADSLQQHIAF